MNVSKLKEANDLSQEINYARQRLQILENPNNMGLLVVKTPSQDSVLPSGELMEEVYCMVVDFWTVRLANLEVEFQNL